MKIFWYQGGLHIQPEGEQEAATLMQITKCLRLEIPPEMQSCIPGGEGNLGSQQVFEMLVRGQQAGPRRFTR
jgi:hypothetical protein